MAPARAQRTPVGNFCDVPYRIALGRGSAIHWRMAGALCWDLLQSLHAVLEAGSFSAAARLRRLTQPTLGRHIDQLERQLGAPLFLRSPRGLQPTDLALAFRPHLADMAAAAST